MRKLIPIICLLALIGCNSAEPERSDQPAFKGMELYSWKPAAKDWHFSLLVGTNRQKPISMIAAPETAIVGVSAIKQKLSALARRENVFWRNMAKEPVPMKVIKDLAQHCKNLDIKLVKP